MPETERWSRRVAPFSFRFEYDERDAAVTLSRNEIDESQRGGMMGEIISIGGVRPDRPAGELNRPDAIPGPVERLVRLVFPRRRLTRNPPL